MNDKNLKDWTNLYKTEIEKFMKKTEYNVVREYPVGNSLVFEKHTSVFDCSFAIFINKTNYHVEAFMIKNGVYTPTDFSYLELKSVYELLSEILSKGENKK